jgi:hypothetical protein
MDGVKDLPVVSDVGRAGEPGTRTVSALEALQLQLLERWSSLLLHTFVSMMAEHATTERVRSEFIAFYVTLAKLHGHVRPARRERPAGA